MATAGSAQEGACLGVVDPGDRIKLTIPWSKVSILNEICCQQIRKEGSNNFVNLEILDEWLLTTEQNQLHFNSK